MQKEPLKNIAVLIISYLYILLFVYAAVSKLLDFENFQVQLGQSPLLSAFAGWVSWLVLIIEFLLAFLLMYNRTRFIGLVGSFLLMGMFTAYIYIILNYSSFIPCSCGGVLEKMTWNQHLLFNVIFMLMAMVAILMLQHTKRNYLYLLTGGLLSFFSVYALFLKSEDIIKHHNNFIRRFSDHVVKDNQIDLNYNSYYFAGNEGSKLYLGNYTAPLFITQIDTSLTEKKKIAIRIEEIDLPFNHLQLKIIPPRFYLFDGSISCLFSGDNTDWKAKLVSRSEAKFANGILYDSLSILYRTHDKKGENIIGKTIFTRPEKTFVNPSILKKQFDGNFDTDGILQYDSYWKKFVYLYRYRNEYMVFDTDLNLLSKGNTIDTISKAQIKVAYVKRHDEKKLAQPPLTVNQNSTAYRGLMFVNSSIIGKYEDEKIWRQASVIDVYNIRNKAYVASFYVYFIDKNKASRFFVIDGHFYAFIGRYLVRYKLTEIITSQFLPETELE